MSTKDSTASIDLPITLKVRDQVGEEMFFKLRSGTSFSKIFDEIAERKEWRDTTEKNFLRFLWDGERLMATDTPKLLEMEENDEIDVVLEQKGGAVVENEEDDLAGLAGPIPSEGEEPITLKVRDQVGEEMFFKVKKGTALSKIFHAYAQRRGVAVDTLRFLLDDTRLTGTDTPKMMEMEDNDQIDVYLEQLGGFFCCACQQRD